MTWLIRTPLPDLKNNNNKKLEAEKDVETLEGSGRWVRIGTSHCEDGDRLPHLLELEDWPPREGRGE